MMVHYRGNESLIFAEKVQNWIMPSILFNAKELETFLSSLKYSSSRKLKSNVVDKISDCYCNSTYVGQTIRHLSIRIDRHMKEDKPIGQLLG